MGYFRCECGSTDTLISVGMAADTTATAESHHGSLAHSSLFICLLPQNCPVWPRQRGVTSRRYLPFFLLCPMRHKWSPGIAKKKIV